jgi:outer membrane protein assembly factor BamB
MVTPEKNPPVNWNYDPDDASKNANIKWMAELGSKSYGNPVVANGMVYIGTNNAARKNPSITADGGVEMAFDEQSGKLLWQQYYSKLPAGRVNDWPGEGLCSTTYAEPGRIWYCTNQCHVVCLDVSPGNKEPKVVWDFDMMGKLGVFPHNMTSSSIASHGDLIYVMTGNGVEDTHKHVVAPQAPGLVCFNKNTGAVKWTDNSAGPNVLHGQWSSVAIAPANGKTLVIAPMGDAWVRAFEAETGKLVWKFDANPKNSIYPQTRNEIIATPVIVNNLMYIANGQDPEHGTGYGYLWCVDITGQGDVSAELDADPNAPKPGPGQELLTPAAQVPSRKGKPNPNSKVKWVFGPGQPGMPETERMHRTICTATVSDGLLFIGDFSGNFHCLDANTGKQYWGFDCNAEIWGSSMICDGKVYQGDGDGNVRIWAADKVEKLIAEHNMGDSVFGSPVYSNGTLYILSMRRLFAIQEKK